MSDQSISNPTLVNATSVTPMATPSLVSSGTSDTVILMRMLERAASDPTIDLDRMERLFGMLKEIEGKRAEASYAAAMAAAQKQLVPVAKNQFNKQTNSKYADLAAVVEAAMPIINGMGFAVSASEIPAKDGHFGMTLDVSHSGGCTKRYKFQVPLDGAGFKGTANKTATHAYGSSYSYARRYAICGVFNIATKDNDGNGQTNKTNNEPISESQRKTLTDLIDKAGVSIDAVLAFHKIDILDDMPVSEFKRAQHMLGERIKNAAKSSGKSSGVAP